MIFKFYRMRLNKDKGWHVKIFVEAYFSNYKQFNFALNDVKWIYLCFHLMWN